jgi:hypothetical protein
MKKISNAEANRLRQEMYQKINDIIEQYSDKLELDS